MKKKKTDSKTPEFPRSIETFDYPDAYVLRRLTTATPSCFNGAVSVRRYRVTFEEIDEPKDVVIERLRKLWRETDNRHHWAPLQKAAATLGIELMHSEREEYRRSLK